MKNLWIVDNFLCYCTLFTRCHEKVDARTFGFQAVVNGMGFASIVGHETVNKASSHVVHFDFDVPAQMSEIKRHLAFVWIRNDIETQGP